MNTFCENIKNDEHVLCDFDFGIEREHSLIKPVLKTTAIHLYKQQSLGFQSYSEKKFWIFPKFEKIKLKIKTVNLEKDV